MTDRKTYSGAIALIGSPNVGKSTLLNRILGRKVSIVSDKPQTTRQRILGIYTEGDRQLIFVDSPGIGRPIGHHSTHMNRIAENAKYESDIILWMLDAKKGVGDNDRDIFDNLAGLDKPLIAVFNKMDATINEAVVPMIDDLNKSGRINAFFPVSAKTGHNLEALTEHLLGIVPENPFLYDPDEVTDQSDTAVITEYVREQIFLNSKKELPYQVGVEMNEMDENEAFIFADVSILVEQPRIKKILIGKGGEFIKNLRQNAQRHLKKYFNKPVKLTLVVKVRQGLSV